MSSEKHDGSTPTDTTRADAHPTKEFFVKMLTRDISLEDTVLDLLDNCLDGVVRTLRDHGAQAGERPYEGFWAKIHLDGDWFSIEDNCGGIDLETLRHDAFRLGRPASEKDMGLGTVGFYGIGMKRAIFKIGKEANVTTRHAKEGEYEVDIPLNWVDNADWFFNIKPIESPTLADPGTRIMISTLNDTISEQFKNKSFINGLQEMIRQTYAIVMRKGFAIHFGGDELKPAELQIYVANEGGGILPYAFNGSIDGVNISLACGFYRTLATETEIDEEKESKQSANDAGWTIICNDRVVVFQDRTALSGWGTGGLPSFHNQFKSICGVVEFTSSEVNKLPLTTTKHGIDASSTVYLKTREYMIKGTKIFTNFTNKWKGIEEQTNPFFANSKKVIFTSACQAVVDKMRDVPNSDGALAQLIPDLPLPPKAKTATRKISFTKPLAEINRVSELLFSNVEEPNVVGAECFDYTLKALG